MGRKVRRLRVKDSEGRKHISLNELAIYTDGSCTLNPGGASGAAAIIIHRHSGKELELAQGFKASTNNRMELMALILALKALKRPTSFTLYTDSQYLQKPLAAKTPIKSTKNLDLWTHINMLIAPHTYEVVWVKGHSGDYYNERCDILAANACLQYDAAIVDTGYQVVPEPFSIYEDQIPKRRRA